LIELKTLFMMEEDHLHC